MPSSEWPIYLGTSAGTPMAKLITQAGAQSIFDVADTTERAAVITALAAAGVDTTIVYVHRRDAAAGVELERTTDAGSTWSPIPAGDTGWTNMSSFSNSFSAGTATPRYRKVGLEVFLDGELFRSSAPGTSELLAFTLPAGYRPLSTVAFTTITFGSLAKPTMVVIATDGSIKVACATGRTATPGFLLSGISFLAA